MRLASRAARVGLDRVVVPSRLGEVVVLASQRCGDVALLLLHGAAGSWATWLPLMEEAERLGRPLTNVVAIDLPGWGESGALRQHSSVEQMTDAVLDVVLALGYSEWTVAGHSLGGHLARNFAALPWLAGMLAAMRLLNMLGPVGLMFVRWLHLLGWLRSWTSPLFACPRRIDDEVIDALSREVRPQAFLRAAAAARNFDERVWVGIRCPVLVLRGERDVFVGSGDAAWFDARSDCRCRSFRARGAARACSRSDAVGEPGYAGERLAITTTSWTNSLPFGGAASRWRDSATLT